MKGLDRKSAIKKLKNLVFVPKAETLSFRSALEQEFKTVIVPNNVECDRLKLGSLDYDYLVPEIFSKDRVIVYVHGGSFVGGSCKAYRSFCASIANSSTTIVYVPEFRLAPENPFPASIEDVSRLIDSITDKEIVLMADGSGASIALACVFNMARFERKKIKEIILFSPWLDFGIDSILYTQKKTFDEILSSQDMRRSVDFYTYRSNQKTPLVSPVFASSEDLANFPSVYIQNGGDELNLQSAKEFCHLLFKNGIQCTLDTWPNMMFMFQMADEFVPQAHLAIEKIGMHIQNRELLSEL